MNRFVFAVASLLCVASLTAIAQTSSAPAPTTALDANSLQAALREYAGTCTFSSGSPISTYSVTVKDGSLHGDAGMGNYKLLKQEKADQFKSTSSYGSIITFTRDATTKAVTGLTLAAQDQELSATKEK